MHESKLIPLMKTAAELLAERELFHQATVEKRIQEVKEWFAIHASKIESEIFVNGSFSGKLHVLPEDVFGVYQKSEKYPYELGAVSDPTYVTICEHLVKLGYNVHRGGNTPYIITLKISLSAMNHIKFKF